MKDTRSHTFQTEQFRIAAAQAISNRNWSALEKLATDWVTAELKSTEAWQNLSHAFFEQSDFANAMSAFDNVLALQPDQPALQIDAARIALAAQAYDKAKELLLSAEAKQPASVELLFALSRLYYLTGELELAERYCRRVIELRQNHPTVYVTLGMLRQGDLSDAEIQRILELYQNPKLHPEYRTMLGFTLGDAMDKRNKPNAAFTFWQQANALNKTLAEQEGYVYQPVEQEVDTKLIQHLFATPWGSDEGEDNCVSTSTKSTRDDSETTINNKESNAVVPIFVLGMPRSGSTLVESILAAHSDVTGAGELNSMTAIYDELMHEARTFGLPAARALLDRKAALWRARYLTALPRIGAEKYVVDKQPLNYRAIGIIRVLFPDAPIIYTRRDATEVCFSIFRHKFTKTWPCAHTLNDTAHYYRTHAQLMQFWQASYPNSIHVCDHSLMISQGNLQIDALLKFCRLQPQPNCFEPHKTKRAISTFSAVQVRTPVSEKYLDRSSRYAKNLTELHESLQDLTTNIKNQNGNINRQKWGIK